MNSSTIESGRVTQINNKSGGATTYRVAFPGVGSVSFVVQPGASFELVCESGTVDVNIEDCVPSSVPRLVE